MPKVTEFLSPKDLSTIASHQMLAKQVVEGFCSGLHRSPHKGFSVEFKQHRQYVPGDEIRHLDWKVYGKSDRFYIREYEEETNLRCNILLDTSGSMSYKGETASYDKLGYATRLAACLSYLMLQQVDSAGLVSFDTKVNKQIPPRSRPAHLHQIVEYISNLTPGGETELGKVINEIAPKLERSGMVILISDCFGDVAKLLKSLARLKHSRHEIIIFQIWDRDELEFPFKQWTRFDCLENSSNRHMIDPAHLRASYLENLNKYREELKKGCHRHRIDLVPLTTDQPYADALSYFFAKRKRLV